MQTHSHITLSQLQRLVKETLHERFALPVWVSAEISEIKVNYSGHCYLELVEKGGDNGVPLAQSRAVIWRTAYPRIAGYFEAETGQRLAAGIKILAKVAVNYHELYGFSLQITDIDPTYTLGDMERQRQMTIAQLQKEGVWDMNREAPMPVVVQRVAVVSSANAAGYQDFRKELACGEDVAFVIRKGALSYEEKVEYHNDNPMIREEIIRHIVQASGEDPIVSTTGKASRELFEIREHNGQSHKYDFLTVGSMGHSSSIALGVAVQKPGTKVWCVDGDGAVLMHMGSMAVLGSTAPENMVHIVINNGAHETVGGMPTVAADIDLVSIAKACGYPNAVSVTTYEELDRELTAAKERETLTFIEVKCGIGAREDLGRPTTTALENKQNFMEYLKEC